MNWRTALAVLCRLGVGAFRAQTLTLMNLLPQFREAAGLSASLLRDAQAAATVPGLNSHSRTFFIPLNTLTHNRLETWSNFRHNGNHVAAHALPWLSVCTVCLVDCHSHAPSDSLPSVELSVPLPGKTPPEPTRHEPCSSIQHPAFRAHALLHPVHERPLPEALLEEPP